MNQGVISQRGIKMISLLLLAGYNLIQCTAVNRKKVDD